MSEIDIILATHNHLDLTIQCVEALYAHTNTPFRLIVVDDSTDATPHSTSITHEWLIGEAEKRGNMKIIHSDTPYSHGHEVIQIGLDNSEGDIVAYLGNSTRVEPDWLEPALQIMKQELSIGCIGFKLLYDSGTIEHAGMFWTPDMPHHYNIAVNQPGHRHNYVREVPAVGWALVLLRRAALVQPLDIKTYHGFRGYDDLDECFEMVKRGWKIVYCGLGAAYHKAGATRLEAVDDKFMVEQEENRQTFLKKWGASPEAAASKVITKIYG